MKQTTSIRTYLLEITVFLCGLVVMVFELLGSRILAPYIGTSLSVWTSIIGIILGSLSAGYYIGGKIADKKANVLGLSRIVCGASVGIYLTTVLKEPVLLFLQQSQFSLNTTAVLSSLILFFPTSLLLGMVSPYTVKLKMHSVHTSGSTVGSLYALSTIGSIAGTFFAGFYLIPSFGTTRLLYTLAVCLLALSVFIAFHHAFSKKLLFLVVIAASWGTTEFVQAEQAHTGTHHIDTQYNHVTLYQDSDKKTGKPVQRMKINNENSSAMFLESDELVYEYTKYYDLAAHFNPQFQKTLLLGGAGYSYPKHFLATYPHATIDVVEIDPALTEIAQQHFRLQADERIRIYHEDARTFLNTTQQKYDVIFGDAFSSQYSLPHHLTTQEAVQKKFDVLNNGGVVVVNIISAIEEPQGEFFRAEYATYASVFPQVYLFPVSEPTNGTKVQNVMLVAMKSKKQPSFESEDTRLHDYLQHRWKQEIVHDMPVLTDDYAPVEYYVSKILPE